MVLDFIETMVRHKYIINLVDGVCGAIKLELRPKELLEVLGGVIGT